MVLPYHFLNAQFFDLQYKIKILLKLPTNIMPIKIFNDHIKISLLVATNSYCNLKKHLLFQTLYCIHRHFLETLKKLYSQMNVNSNYYLTGKH